MMKQEKKNEEMEGCWKRRRGQVRRKKEDEEGAGKRRGIGDMKKEK